MELKTKQVILIRRDLKMRRGKEISQACHVSMAFLTKKIDYDTCGYYKWTSNSDEIIHWLENSFRKIVCYVNSEEEMRELYQKAVDKGLLAHIIEDNGATEFHGVKTLTALAIGPAEESKFKGLTDHLPLL